jgi:hypothetical protein
MVLAELCLGVHPGAEILVFTESHTYGSWLALLS